MSKYMQEIKYRESLLSKETLNYNDLQWLLSQTGTAIGKTLFTEHKFFDLGGKIYTSSELLDILNCEIHPDSTFVFNKDDGHYLCDDFWELIPTNR